MKAERTGNIECRKRLHYMHTGEEEIGKRSVKGYWSVSISENWRVIFRFEDNNVFDVNYLDYH